jgi:hypothetical protein
MRDAPGRTRARHGGKINIGVQRALTHRGLASGRSPDGRAGA